MTYMKYLSTYMNKYLSTYMKYLKYSNSKQQKAEWELSGLGEGETGSFSMDIDLQLYEKKNL